MPAALPATPPPSAETGPRLYGVFDIARPDRVAGWAIDRASAAAAVEVLIHREGQLIATVTADRHRADLAKGGVGTGNYGFSVEITPPMEPGFEFTLTVTARSADGTTGDLKRTGGKSAPVTPEQRVIERLFEEVQRLRSAPKPNDTLDRFAETLARLDLTQHRLEAALAGIEPPAPPPPHAALRRILYTTLAIALGSLGLGLYSLFLA